MSAKIAIGMAILLALSGWGLYRQVSANGELQERLKQREAQLLQERAQIQMLRLEMEARNEATRLLQVELEDLRERKIKVQTIVREVYVQPEVAEWATTAPPAAAIRAVHVAINCLHESADNRDGDCDSLAAAGDAAGLPAP